MEPLSGDERERRIGNLLRVLRIVGSALIAGVTMFIFVLLVMQQFGVVPFPAAPNLPIPLPAVGIAVATVIAAMSFAIKGVILRQATTAAVAGALPFEAVLARFQSATIVGMAFCESGAILVLIFTFLFSGGQLGWAAGVGIPFFGMLLHFPTRGAVDRFLDDVDRARGE